MQMTFIFLMIFPRMGLHCKLVPVQYREYDINLFLMIFPRVSLHCKLVPVQYQEYDINLFLMIFPHMSLHCKLVPVQYGEYKYGLFEPGHYLINICIQINCQRNFGIPRLPRLAVFL